MIHPTPVTYTAQKYGTGPQITVRMIKIMRTEQSHARTSATTKTSAEVRRETGRRKAGEAEAVTPEPLIGADVEAAFPSVLG
jgi:hypothetical protein